MRKKGTGLTDFINNWQAKNYELHLQVDSTQPRLGPKVPKVQSDSVGPLNG